MKIIIFALSMLFGICTHATPATATKEIFEILVKTDNFQAKLSAPMTIDVKNIVCSIGSGSPKKFACSAQFSKGSLKNIEGNNNIFFQHLSEKNAIALDDVKKGGSTYTAKSISCSYSLDQQPYYNCTSDVSIKF